MGADHFAGPTSPAARTSACNSPVHTCRQRISRWAKDAPGEEEEGQGPDADADAARGAPPNGPLYAGSGAGAADGLEAAGAGFGLGPAVGFGGPPGGAPGGDEGSEASEAGGRDATSMGGETGAGAEEELCVDFRCGVGSLVWLLARPACWPGAISVLPNGKACPSHSTASTLAPPPYTLNAPQARQDAAQAGAVAHQRGSAERDAPLPPHHGRRHTGAGFGARGGFCDHDNSN